MLLGLSPSRKLATFSAHNAWIHLSVLILAVGLGAHFNISSTEWMMLILAAGFVLAAEAFNTAIEIDMDLTSPEYHPFARDTKDVAAGAVLVASLTALVIGILIFLPFIAHGQEMVPDKQVTMKAKVLDILNQERRLIPGTDTETNFQQIRVEVLDGEEKGKALTVDNDYLNLKRGEVFYLMHVTNEVDGTNAYVVKDPYRLPAVFFFVGLFVLCVLFFGGIQGVRGLLALFLSFFFILYLLLPGILHGYSPVLMSIGISSLIIILGSYITHGFNKTTSSAVIGMITTIIFTGFLAHAAVDSARLSGYYSEEAVSLHFNTHGAIDFTGLLLGGILIGLLGVLYDVAIGQAVAVEELARAGEKLSRREVYLRALRIGREHIGALVNTLAIAYVGVSLPLLLLFSQSSAGVWEMVNQEIFSTEIIRIMIGSIGLVLAVPITTFISVFVLVRR